ncbi:uncharacterized protein LOC134543053 isoform X5 [Bacillus rossius redtenbacheri]|uniref:uncharacterized protein LOC134543053 isoform X5 n=1 Tax=Bacillus rossius redtenbacheri TaxID=93214 RepID=UPI002FDD2936
MPEQGTTDAKRKAGNECMDFEGAINQAGHGKFHYCLLLGCALCLVSTVCEIYGTAYLLPAAQCDFNMTAQQKGLLGSIALIGVICSSQLWGYLADSLGRKKIIVFTLAMDAVCGIASSLAPDFYSFLIVRFFGGFFICGAATVVYVYIGEFHAEANRAKFIILLSVVVSLSSIFQPVVRRNNHAEIQRRTTNRGSWSGVTMKIAVEHVLSGKMSVRVAATYFNVPKSSVRYTQPTQQNPVLLLLDGHSSHKNLAVLCYASEHNVHMISTPPHTTHKLQLLDRTLMKPFKNAYAESCALWMRQNAGLRIKENEIAGLVSSAYRKYCHLDIASNGFSCTDIYHFNPGVFSDLDFIPSLLTEIPEAHEVENTRAPSNDPVTATQPSCSSISNQATETHSPIPMTETSDDPVKSPRSITSRPNVEDNNHPSTSTNVTNVLKTLSPLPDANKRRSSCRKRIAQRSEILTSSPYKEAVVLKTRPKTKKYSTKKT